jgi:DNA-binding NarL/FixJ family response regulator
LARILLFTDQPVLAHGLGAILQSVDGLELVSTCNSTDDLALLVETHEPELVLLDRTSERTFGQLAELKSRRPACKIVLWVHSISKELAFQAMSLGVRGILRKTLASDLLIKCLQKVLNGELWFEKALTDSFLTAETVALTEREGQLVTLLAQGLRNKEIAAMLGISETTVKIYLSRLFQKVGVQDRFELALYGLKNLTTLQAALEWSPRHGERAGRHEIARIQKLRSLVLERPKAAAAPRSLA